MLRFIIRRVIVIIPMLFIILSITWGLIRLAPGNFYTGEKKLAPAVEANLRAKYGLDKAWYVQYGRVLWNMARFDFGTSLKYEGQSVNQILWRAFPVSAALGFSAYLIALVVGIIYWMIFAVFTKFGEVGNLPAILSAWSANVLFAIAAVYLFLNVET